GITRCAFVNSPRRRGRCLQRSENPRRQIASPWSCSWQEFLNRLMTRSTALATTNIFGLEPPAEIAEAVEMALVDLAHARELERNSRADDSLLLAHKPSASAAQLAYAPLQAEALVQVARALDGR